MAIFLSVVFIRPDASDKSQPLLFEFENVPLVIERLPACVELL